MPSSDLFFATLELLSFSASPPHSATDHNLFFYQLRFRCMVCLVLDQQFLGSASCRHVFRPWAAVLELSANIPKICTYATFFLSPSKSIVQFNKILQWNIRHLPRKMGRCKP
ncbi:hypothetical protein M5689_000798 [Euphorbia peplus]|nr:hypothetical protein M5689_000798 [Euphorbia peplus]